MEGVQTTLFTLPTPDMPKLDISRCEARSINYETAANMVKTFHYAHRVPSIATGIGMYVDDTLAGCITYGTFPASNAAAICGEEYQRRALELTRLFIHDWAGRNAESWLIGQSFRLLPALRGLPLVLVSYADTGANHVGYIYQATNWLYTGHTAHHHYELADGAVVQSRSAWNPKIGETAADFYRRNPGSKPIRSSPKHRYIYFLGSKKERKALKRALRWPVLPYPK
jgi:hypothetical protein